MTNIDQKNFQGKVAIKIFMEDENGNLLVIRQKHDEPFEVPGGRVDENESIESTIKRELKEELGIDIENVKPDIIDSFQAVNPHEQIPHLYLIVHTKISDELKYKMSYTEEVKEMVWVNKTNYQNYNFKKFLEGNIIKFINRK